ncbi:helix-turn-helix domain-containing protein [Streptomyces sp. NPDC003077]|uniref:helix-turn-helix domain-containing protein n=1 Tax=Streptomyces sp. NPDC003077 TaxID=3154443 RepID=UPI0033BF698C
MNPGTVAIVVTDDADIPLWDLYELSVAYTVFGIPQPDLADRWYTVRLCGSRDAPPPEGAPPAPGGSGLMLRAGYGFEDLVDADTVIVPSVPEACITGERPFPAGLIRALRRAYDGGSRMVSLCAGAFALAEAGVLDGRRATAHWQHTAELAQRYPKVRVDDSVLYVDDGDVLTSAGSTAGLDLCLHLVRRDLGARVANQLARRLVVPAHRPGGQAQFISTPVPATDDESLAPVLAWACERLDQPLTVADLARRAAMSPRTFHRRLLETTGTTPLRWLLHQRLTRVRDLLESTTLPVERVAELGGFGTSNNLRHHFVRHVGVSPVEYRRAFPGGGAADAASAAGRRRAA